MSDGPTPSFLETSKEARKKLVSTIVVPQDGKTAWMNVVVVSLIIKATERTLDETPIAKLGSSAFLSVANKSDALKNNLPKKDPHQLTELDAYLPVTLAGVGLTYAAAYAIKWVVDKFKAKDKENIPQR